MRVVAHLISVLLLVPGIVVASIVVAIGHVTAQPDFARLVNAVLDLMLGFLPFALLVVVVWFALAVLGFSRRWQRAAAISVAAIAAATSAVILGSDGASALTERWGLLVPAAGALVISIWLASTEWPEPVRAIAPGPTATASSPLSVPPAPSSGFDEAPRHIEGPR
jgi:hypothetical protein